MTKRTRNIVLVSLLLIVLGAALVLLTAARGQSGSGLSYNEQVYDVRVLDNGNTRVTMTLDYNLGGRGPSKTWKQLYQTLELQPSGMTNVAVESVRNLTTGETYTQTDPVSASGISDDAWNAHYARHWYIAQTSGSSYLRPYNPKTDGVQPSESESVAKTVEIGWNIPPVKSAKNMRFEVTMTLAGCVTAYAGNDMFSWQPISEDSEMTTRRLRGTIRFPQPVDASDSSIWLHYDGVSKDGYHDGAYTFSIDNVRAQSSVHVGAFLPAGSIAHPSHTSPVSGQTMIEREEERQDSWRSVARGTSIALLCGCGFLLMVAIALAAFGIVLVRRQRMRAQRLRSVAEYSRELPPMSPGAAEILYDTANGVSVDRKLVGRQLGATMLSLVTKNFVRIYPGPADLYVGVDMLRTNSAALARMIAARGAQQGVDVDSTSTVVLLPRAYDHAACRRSLCASELMALDMLRSVGAQLGGPVFDAQRLSDCMGGETGRAFAQSFHTCCCEEFERLGVCEPQMQQARVAGIFSFAFAEIAAELWVAFAGGILLPLIVVGVFGAIGGVLIMGQTAYTITDRGIRLAAQVRGLGRYLEDFSHFADRGVLDTTLWGRYMVYATAFGIADKAMEQVTAAYPQMAETAWMGDAIDGYSVLYWANAMTRMSRGWGDYASGFTLVGGFADIGARMSVGFGDVVNVVSAAAGAFSGGSGGWKDSSISGWKSGGR